jgi:hypothetical protein
MLAIISNARSAFNVDYMPLNCELSGYGMAALSRRLTKLKANS